MAAPSSRLRFGVVIAAVVATGELMVRLSGEAASVAQVRYGIFRLSDDPRLVFELAPGSAGLGTTVNSGAFRGETVSREKPAGIFRVAFVGAGFTFGEEVSEGQTYPHLVEARVNAAVSARGRVARLQALNFGVPGYVLPELVRRVEDAANFRPDLIVLTLGEPVDERRADIMRGFDGRFDPDVEGAMLAKLGELPTIERLMRRSRFATLLFDRLRQQNVVLQRRARLVPWKDMRAKDDWTVEAAGLRRRLGTTRLVVSAFGDAASMREVREALQLADQDLMVIPVVPARGADAQRATAEALLSGVLRSALPEGLRPTTETM